MIKTGLEHLGDYVFYKNYSQRKEDGSLETWEESVDRIYDMHKLFLQYKGYYDEPLGELLEEARKLEKAKFFLSSQRARQFASRNFSSGILKHHAKIYNCSSTLIDRERVFAEVMYLLLCGCGVGYSLHKEHIQKLPAVAQLIDTDQIYSVQDSIEGWSYAIDVLMHCAFNGGKIPTFDYGQIRPAGSTIDGKFTAPGPEPLITAMTNIRQVLNSCQGRQMKSTELHTILCHIASAVISGGVRRSAMIALFDKDDEGMKQIKTGNWYEEHRELAMANNSILTVYGEPLSYGEYKEILEFTKQYGEPGFIKVDSYNHTLNPCAEIVMNPVCEDGTGFAFCNLVEINCQKVDSPELFLKLCRVASFVATIQSLYTDFKFLHESTKMIAERDRAIGVSLTGIMASDLMKGKLLTRGAETVVQENVKTARILNINPCKRCTTVKPSGSATTILNLYCPGIHPAHDRTYLRRVRTTALSPEWKALVGTPMAKYENKEYIISFPCVVAGKVITKPEITAVEHLKTIGMVKHFWVNKGVNPNIDQRPAGLYTDHTSIPNNVSCTVEVSEDEWDEVAAVMYVNSHLYTGVSFLPKYPGTYPNLPFTSITEETIQEYNDIVAYLEANEIDFHAIMSGRKEKSAGELGAVACNGGACEII